MSRGEESYKERLLALDLLQLTFDREIKDLVFLYKALFGYLNVNISNYVSFLSHGRTRLSKSSKYILQVKIVKLALFNRPIITVLSRYGTLYVEKYLSTLCLVLVLLNVCLNKDTLYSIANSVYDVVMACTWSLFRDCSCHRM